MKNLYENLCFAISVMLAGSSFASENPVYQENPSRVTIPLVTADGKQGVYQDIELRFRDSHVLELVALQEGFPLTYIEQADVFLTNTFPVQAFLEISGNFPGSCGDIGYIAQRWTDNTLIIDAYLKNDDWVRNPEQVACTLMLRPFKHVIPLEVYGLSAGVYQYKLNNKFTGSFTLTTHNRLP